LYVIIFFVIICIPAFFGISLVNTNFEISAFMPHNANSITGAQIENNEFSSSMLVYVLLEDKDNWQTLALKHRIETIKGVEKVNWMDDMLDIYTPEKFLSQKAVEQYKKGGSTLMIIEFYSDAAQETIDSAIGQITVLMQQGEYFGGPYVVIHELKNMLREEQALYLVMAGGILIILLAVSLSSYIAPFLCIINIGIAILLNYGTNFIVKDQVSFLTVAIAAIFQLAISMDFSIFLIHRFEEELSAANGDTKKAMISAMHTTLVTISSSALTDCAGFIALIFMHNQIGSDLGIVLCKGVIFSLILSLTFLPCMMLATYQIGKKKHRVLLPSFKKASGPLVKYRYMFLGIVIITLIPTLIASGKQDYYYTTENFMPGDTAPIVATKKISETFGTTDSVNVLYKKEMAGYEKTAIKKIAQIDNIREVKGLSDSVETGVPEGFLPDQLKKAYIGDEYRRFAVTLAGELDNTALFCAVEDIRSSAESSLGEVYITGAYASAADMASTAAWDNVAVELISIAFIFIILLFAFRSLLIPVFLVIVIKAAIYINVGINYFSGEEMIFLTPVFVGAIQLGATVDYAILFTSRYFEFRHQTLDAAQAVRKTIGAAMRPMLTSVLTFFFSTLSITIVSSIKATREIATVVGRGALISFVVIMFALPALFVLFDKPLLATTQEFRKRFYPKKLKDRG
ncbi:MAG: efflux RND transporter permease subunit, partial [Christensenellales bacterium]